ncbi:peptide/nickel transport system substrate-binding protein [Humitalea rosea]|uniref:Peptide/nickel transport system substrate-binding protein n=1 Tax=Humitalea rosea TaxID=990373 RepID=A0A2W7I9N9_9PROT|nr:ABC transporter substrate-binding protein [Humitalea rosea]PZW43099.1 peptide/nickel transport system substrate-binding protein [Humitalea rosea]
MAARIGRRTTLALPAAAMLAAPALGQSDQRPSVTVAVQKISNSNLLEMLREQSNVGTRIFFNYAEPLIGTDWTGDMSIRPGLATSWRRPSENVVEMTLRQGVRFHNGDEMTAEDVAFSFGPDRMFGGGSMAGHEPPRDAIAIARRSFPGFERMEIVDRHTVRFINKVPDVTLEGRLSRTTAIIGSQRGFAEAASWTDWARKPIGTGPYRVAEFRPDQVLVLEAHDDYWGGRPPIRRLRFLEVPEVSGRINMLLSGEADFACDIPPDQIATVESNARYEVVGGPILNTRVLTFDKSHPVLANPLVRRAITHSIDRQAIVDALFSGKTRVPPGLQFEFFGETFAEGWSVPKFDLAEARRLLREANYKGEPIPYRLLNNYYTNQTPTAQVMVEGWRAVGLNIQIEMRENWSQITSRETQRGIRDWSQGASFGDPVAQTPPNFGRQGSAWISNEWRNEEFGDLSELLETSTDRPARKAAWRRMLEIAEREDPAWTVLHQNTNFTAKRRDLGWKSSQTFVMDFRNDNWGV